MSHMHTTPERDENLGTLNIDPGIDPFELSREVERIRGEAMARLLRKAGSALFRGARMTVFGIFRLIEAIGQGVACSRLYHELSTLDDRTLADIGLRREDIPHFVARAQGLLDGTETPVSAPQGLDALPDYEARKIATPAANEPRRRAA